MPFHCTSWRFEQGEEPWRPRCGAALPLAPRRNRDGSRLSTGPWSLRPDGDVKVSHVPEVGGWGRLGVVHPVVYVPRPGWHSWSLSACLVLSGISAVLAVRISRGKMEPGCASDADSPSHNISCTSSADKPPFQMMYRTTYLR